MYTGVYTFLHGSIFCLGIYMSVSKPSICFWKFQISEGTSCLFTTLILQVIERVHVVYSSWFSWRYGSLLRFGIAGPRFFPSVAATMTSKRFCEIAYKCTFECYGNYEVKITRILLKIIFYSSCERALKNERVKSKIVGKSSFGDMIFLTSHDYIWLLFICFLYCAKEGIVVEISEVKWVSRLKNHYRYAKLVENARINFLISLYCILLFSRK